MPAKSQSQRAYLAIHFGPAWLREHHFNNKGPLPKYVGDKKPKKRRSKKSSNHVSDYRR